jgi:hypothetical protein
MGVSVKSRSRSPGTENTPLSIPKENYDRVKDACRAFRCKPYFAIVIDGGATIRAFLLPMHRLKKLCPPGQRVSAWQMSDQHLRQYYADSQITVVELNNNRAW